MSTIIEIICQNPKVSPSTVRPIKHSVLYYIPTPSASVYTVPKTVSTYVFFINFCYREPTRTSLSTHMLNFVCPEIMTQPLCPFILSKQVLHRISDHFHLKITNGIRTILCF